MRRRALMVGFCLILNFLVAWSIRAEEDTSRLRSFGPEMKGFRKPIRGVTMIADGFLWLDAEDFADYGGWRIDTQFVHTMGSAYLLAADLGTPVADAVTTIDIPKAGKYRVWVRAKNWHPEHSPGQFTMLIDGRRSEEVFGKAPTDRWMWQSAGEFDLSAKPTQLVLRDLTGYFARCDALILTTDLTYRPPDEMEAVQKERSRLTGVSLEPRDEGHFDVIVVGAGTAGCSAAIASARVGAKTALVQNRPVLGGNASIELGVGVAGAGCRRANSRESGIMEEAGRIRTRFEFHKMSEPFRVLAEREENLTVFVNRHVFAVDMSDDTSIKAVRAIDTLTGRIHVYHARQFIDCTGDGWVGYYAGAKYRMGRESREEFGEDLAPAEADMLTMSGCLMGNLAISYRAEDMGKPVDYTPPPWAAKLPVDDFGRSPRGFAGGQWWLEHQNEIDDLEDPEFARDELIRISFGYWDWIKNHWSDRAKAKNYALVYVPHGDAKRETRRLIGEYIFKQQDAQEAVVFPDRIAHGGWPLDVHHPRGIYSGAEGPYYCNYHPPIYGFPFRSLYSVNIENLLFAGRHVSVTHIALGTVRVQGTLATFGQAAGTAAAMCVEHDMTPQQLCYRRIGELQQLLLKHDQYIPDLKNEDPADLALTSKVTASSWAQYDFFGPGDVTPDILHPLNMPRAVMFPRGEGYKLKSVRLLLRSARSEPIDVTLRVRQSTVSGDFSSTKDLCTVTATVPPGRESFVSFPIEPTAATKIDSPFVWVWLPKTEGVEWRLMDSKPYQACRGYGGSDKRPWTVVENQAYAFCTDPPLAYATDYRPENVISGVARMVDRTSNLWVSDPAEALPQWIELEFPQPVTLDTVYLTFDTDMNAAFHRLAWVPQSVRDYTLSCFDGRRWVDLATEKENFQRRRIHRFDTLQTTKLRLTIEATNGAPSARVFEIRAYDEP